MGKSPHRHMERRRIKIAVLGAGNVATHLARALSDSADVVQIFSNKIEKHLVKLIRKKER